MKFYSYFDGKTQFSQIFMGCIFFFFFFFFFFRGGGGRLSPVCVTDGRTDVAYGPTVKLQIQLQELRDGQADKRT